MLVLGWATYTRSKVLGKSSEPGTIKSFAIADTEDLLVESQSRPGAMPTVNMQPMARLMARLKCLCSFCELPRQLVAPVDIYWPLCIRCKCRIVEQLYTKDERMTLTSANTWGDQMRSFLLSEGSLLVPRRRVSRH